WPAWRHRRGDRRHGARAGRRSATGRQRPGRLSRRVHAGLAHVAANWPPVRRRGHAPKDKAMATFDLSINGRAVSVTVANEETSRLAVLRDELNLVGTRFGCGLEQCGCCMVLIDGAPAKSCAKPIWSVAGKSVTTVEGLGTSERPHPLQRALIDEQAGQ